MESRTTPLLGGLTVLFSGGALALVLLGENEYAAGFIICSLGLMITQMVARRPIDSEEVTQEEVAEKSTSQLDSNFYPGVLPPGTPTESPVAEPESSRDTEAKKYRRKTERQHRNLPDKVLNRKPPVVRQQRGMR